MKERMTGEAVTRAVATVLDDVSHHGAVDAVQALGVECSRARASEKALADALEEARKYAPFLQQPTTDIGSKIDAALRLAGRLP